MEDQGEATQPEVQEEAKCAIHAIVMKEEENTTPSDGAFDEKEEMELLKHLNMRFLPAFADGENRALFQYVVECESNLRHTEEAVEQQDDRTSIMEDHMKRVQEEVVATQMRLEAKRRETATEEHMKKMAEFQAQRLKGEVVKLETEMYEMVDRLSNIQTSIFKGNEKMDHCRLNVHFKQEELEQWAEAAAQKDEDILVLANYNKNDNSHISNLQVEETKASTELASLDHLLQNEIAVTHSHQIQLDRTAEEFRLLHFERQKMICMWEDTIELIHRRDEDIHRVAQDFADNKQLLRRSKRILDNLDKKYYNQVENNKDLTRKVVLKNIDLQRDRETVEKETQSTLDAHEQLVLLKTNHFRAQHELAMEVSKRIQSEEELDTQGKKLEVAKINFEKIKKKVEDEYDHLDTLEQRTHALEKLLETEELNLSLGKKEVDDLRERHFKASEELQHLKTSATNDRKRKTRYIISTEENHKPNRCLNKIQMLELTLLRQDETKYEADYEIQCLERKVFRASGQQSDLEEKEMTKQIKELETDLEHKKYEESQSTLGLKKTNIELRLAIRKKEDLEKQFKQIGDQIEELNLECNASHANNKTLTKVEEEKTLEVDLLQMEVNRLTSLLHSKADEVYNLDCLKQRLQQNMEEQKHEVDAKQEQQRQEIKCIEEDLHNLTIFRKKLSLQVEKLQNKYDILRARVKTGDGEERSAHYYLIKAAQERELLVQHGNELEKEVNKAEDDVETLEFATDQIKESNNNLRTSFYPEQYAELENEQIMLKDDLGKWRDRLRFKEREERSLLQELAQEEAHVQNIEKECKTVTDICEDLQRKVEDVKKEKEEQTRKYERASTQLDKLMKELKDRSPLAEVNKITKELLLGELRDIAKDILYKVRGLANDNPQFATEIEKRVSEAGFKMPSNTSTPRSSRSGSSTSSISSKGSIRASPRSPTKKEFKGKSAG